MHRVRVSTTLYLLAILLGIVLPVLLIAWGFIDPLARKLVLLFCWLPLPLAVVAIYMLLYRSWAAIQDGQARTSPAAAVGLCFVPFFNLYWFFQAWYGFAVDYNRYLRRRRLLVPDLPEGLYLSYCVCVVSSIVPIINLVTGPLSVVLLLLVAYCSCRGINRLADAELEAEAADYFGRPRPAVDSAGLVFSLVAAALLAAAGLALVGLFLPLAQENRRVWLHQQRQVEEKLREIKEWEQRQSPESPMRVQHLREQARFWHPEWEQEAYYLSRRRAGVGMICLLLAGEILLIGWLTRWGRRRTLCEGSVEQAQSKGGETIVRVEEDARYFRS